MHPGFQDLRWFGRVLRCIDPVANGQIIHVVVVYGFQGADTVMEKLTCTEQLFEVVLADLRVVGQGHPHLVLGDFIVEPSNIPCLVLINLP